MCSFPSSPSIVTFADKLRRFVLHFKCTPWMPGTRPKLCNFRWTESGVAKLSLYSPPYVPLLASVLPDMLIIATRFASLWLLPKSFYRTHTSNESEISRSNLDDVGLYGYFSITSDISTFKQQMPAQLGRLHGKSSVGTHFRVARAVQPFPLPL